MYTDSVCAVDAVFLCCRVLQLCTQILCVLLTCAVAVCADALYADAVCVVAVGLALNAQKAKCLKL